MVNWYQLLNISIKAIAYILTIGTLALMHSSFYINKTSACVTEKSNRVGMPKYVKALEVGQMEILNDGTMIVLRWQDKREVRMPYNIDNKRTYYESKLYK